MMTFLHRGEAVPDDRLLRCRRHLPTLLVLAVALCMVPAAPSYADPPPAASPDFVAIDAYIAQEMRELRIPGLALGIVHNDEVAHVQGFGVADASGRVVTPQTPFILASASKSFTSLAIMQLVEDGKVNLDAPVATYLPSFSVGDESASATITVRHLLNHERSTGEHRVPAHAQQRHERQCSRRADAGPERRRSGTSPR